MSAMGVLLAMLLALAAGSALVVAWRGLPRHPYGWAAVLGSGWLLGMLLAASTTWLPSSTEPAIAFGHGVPWLLGIAVLGTLVAWRRRRNDSAVPTTATAVDAHGIPRDGWWWLLLALVLAHLLLAALQASVLPTVPWDAWTTWLGRAKGWYGSDAFVQLLAPADWIAQSDPAVRATLAPHYPQGLSRLAVWIASAAGDWDTRAVHALWPILGVALAAGLYGHLREAGATARLAMIGTFACVSLPLLNAHLALAGYADLWLATAVAFALLHWVHWRRSGARGELALALAFALLLPALKLEGAVWLACMLVAAAWSLLPARLQLWLPVAALVVAGLVMLWGGLALPLPGLGVVRLAWGEIEIPAMGTLALHWRPVGSEVLSTLFLLPNWHLLWIVLPVLVLVHRGALRADPALRALAVFLALAATFLLVLFFFTDAAAWAENLTSVNRVLLHVAPACVAFLTLLVARAMAAQPVAPTVSSLSAQPGTSSR